MNWWCALERHEWLDFGSTGGMPARIRECRKCGRRQGLFFYSNRTQEWEDEADWLTCGVPRANVTVAPRPR